MPRFPTVFAAVALSLAACSSVASSGDDAASARVADGATVQLDPGEVATLADGSTLRYERLVNDSRCAPDVQCVWAGDAEVAFTWRSAGGGRDAFSLHTGRGDKSHRIGDRTVTLVALGRRPLPDATLEIAAGG
jgi:hypothetical protein